MKKLTLKKEVVSLMKDEMTQVKGGTVYASDCYSMCAEGDYKCYSDDYSGCVSFTCTHDQFSVYDDCSWISWGFGGC